MKMQSKYAQHFHGLSDKELKEITVSTHMDAAAKGVARLLLNQRTGKTSGKRTPLQQLAMSMNRYKGTLAFYLKGQEDFLLAMDNNDEYVEDEEVYRKLYHINRQMLAARTALYNIQDELNSIRSFKAEKNAAPSKP